MDLSDLPRRVGLLVNCVLLRRLCNPYLGERVATMKTLMFVVGILAAVTVLGTTAVAQHYPWCAITSVGCELRFYDL